jgi:arylsulfatase A
MRGMFRRFVFLFVTLCAFLGVTDLAADESALPSKRPNVIFILADDLGYGDVGCFGQTKIPTPNIDALAKQGVRLTQHYSGAPVCAPSRCVLMTGKHLGHAEIRGNQQAKVRFPQFTEGQHPLSESALTLAEHFKQLGYRTAAFGKWGLGPVGSTGDPNAQGFDLFFGYNCQAVAHSFYPSHVWRNNEKVLLNPKPIPGHKKQPAGEVKMEDWIGEQYAPTRMIAEAEKFLAEQDTEPFFLYLPFIEPHVAMHPPQASVERFPTEWDNVPYRGQCGYLPHPRPRAAYAAMVSDLDSYVGRIMKLVHDKGLDKSTLIIFTSDNGATHAHAGDPNFHVGGADAKFFNSTAGLNGYKGSVYEGGIRVPTVVSWPGVLPAGTTNSQPSYFADWFPTFCELSDAAVPAGLDGESLWSLIRNNETRVRTRPMLWVFPEYTGQVAVRIGDYKVIKQGLKTKKPREWEVYDLAKDRSESENIAERHPELIAQAIEILQEESSSNEIYPLDIPAK